MEVIVKDFLKRSKFHLIIPVMILSFLLHPVANLMGEDEYIPKDPRFARRLGFITGVATPLFLGSLGMGISGPSDSTTPQVIGITMVTLGFLTPPLGNYYAGELNKGIAAVYGAANLSWMIGTISYYRKGIPDRDPTVAEGIFWLLGFALRIPAGIWDWTTAAETAVRKNAEMRGITRKGFITSFIEPDGSGMRFTYNQPF